MRWWFSGRILACHAGDRGSIPRQRIRFYILLNNIKFEEMELKCFQINFKHIFDLVHNELKWHLLLLKWLSDSPTQIVLWTCSRNTFREHSHMMLWFRILMFLPPGPDSNQGTDWIIDTKKFDVVVLNSIFYKWSIFIVQKNLELFLSY